MKTKMIACGVGLLAISWLTGCGANRPFQSSSNGANTSIQPSGGSSAPKMMKMLPAEGSAAPPKNILVFPADSPRPGNPLLPSRTAPAIDVNRPRIVPRNTLPELPNVLPPTSSKDPDRPLPNGLEPQSTRANALPLEKEQDKIVVLSLEEAKLGKQQPPPVEKGSSGSAENADLLDALNQISGKPVAPKEKIIAIESTQIRYGQAENYKQLTGQLQQWRKTWRVRYAAVDMEDTYGGSVVLEGITDPSRLRDGQHVRVRGVLIVPENRQDSTRYTVQSIEILD